MSERPAGRRQEQMAKKENVKGPKKENAKKEGATKKCEAAENAKCVHGKTKRRAVCQPCIATFHAAEFHGAVDKAQQKFKARLQAATSKENEKAAAVLVTQKVAELQAALLALPDAWGANCGDDGVYSKVGWWREHLVLRQDESGDA